ncbi:tetratricopeptide repeat-containing protein [Solimonas flava]|uniref:tetratricopeptide repeat-containing protein n=1 Tax=Solimonas flava TaxID=415849 RepID=UPI000400E6E2|nr:tetratricopeptide repeat-containing protein [Solimonas flava]
MGIQETVGIAGVPTLPLREWLAAHRRASGGARCLSVGGCGHLLLSRSEARRARLQLTRHVLPALLGDGATRLSLFVGMAPGADMLFLDTAAEWLRAHNIPFEMTALLPVPIPHLLHDWVLRAQDEHRQISRAGRRRLEAEAEQLLQCCSAVVPLYPDDVGAATFSSRAFRQHQYRRLAAIIAQHADHLVAILRPFASGEPGGTAEIVAWRRTPARIPSELRLHAVHCAEHGQLHLVDPTREDAPSEGAAPIEDDELSRVLRAAEAARRVGNELSCNDIVYRALKGGLRSRRLDYLRIQSLANTGNVQMALDHYRSLDLGDEEIDEDWLALHGRLEKDLALGGTDAQQYARAARAYLVAFRRHGGYYSAINAASMLMLAGRRSEARRLARQALQRLAAEPADDEIAQFYQLATRAEAALLLDETEACRTHLSDADRLLRDDITRRSRTRLQLRTLCLRLGRDPALIDALHLPPVVLLQRAETADTKPATPDPVLPTALRTLARQRALLHLALSSPLELALGEQLATRGARLYLTLPATPAELARYWRRAGSGVTHRLQHLLDAADGVAVLRGFLTGEQRWAGTEAAAASRGLARLGATRLGLPLQVLDYAPAPRLRCRAGSDEGLAKRPADGGSAQRRMVGLIFADFASFRRLRDPVFPRYYRDIMQSLARVLDRRGGQVLVRQTWGDALHVVTADAASAAHIVADIQQYIEKRRLRHDGVLADLELRIAAHYAPAYAGYDPIEQKASYYGTQLSFAARIEPVVPPGMIYVTEAFAARLALEAPAGFMLDYAGEVDLAKQFGTYRLYALRRT